MSKAFNSQCSDIATSCTVYIRHGDGRTVTVNIWCSSMVTVNIWCSSLAHIDNSTINNSIQHGHCQEEYWEVEGILASRKGNALGTRVVEYYKNAAFSDTLAPIFLYYVNALGLRRTKPFHMFFLLFSYWNFHMFSAIVHSHNHMLTPFISFSITCYFRLFPLFPQLW